MDDLLPDGELIKRDRLGSRYPTARWAASVAY
jgi:hypothetical protein